MGDVGVEVDADVVFSSDSIVEGLGWFYYPIGDQSKVKKFW